MKDVHAREPDSGRLPLHEVGVAAIKKPLTVQRGDRVVTLTATFEVSVDLPAARKGSDLSRNAELLAEAVDDTVTRPVASLEAACSAIARELLVRHPYASRSRATGRADYFLKRGVHPDRESFEDYLLLAEARATRAESGIRVVREVGTEAVGMTACPCAMENVRDRLEAEYPALRDPTLRDLPLVTHNQRNRTRLTFALDAGAEVEADRMIEAIEAAQSSPTYAILKRGDEARVVVEAHRRPRFVEDVLRDLLSSLGSRFPDLPDSTGVEARTTSEESIHKYNVVAAHRATLGELRRPSGA